MNANTVILDIERYNELRDLETNVNNGKYLVLEIDNTFQRREIVFFTENKVHEKLHHEAEKLKESNNKMKKVIKNLEKDVRIKENELKSLLEAELLSRRNDNELFLKLRKMSIWDFLRWRRNVNNK